MSWSRIDDMLDPRARELLHGRHLLLNDQNQHFRMGVPDGVQIVGFTPDMKIVAITETKPDSETYTHLPSGTVKPGQSADEAAANEFEEEAGYRFKHLVPVVTAQQAPAHLIGNDVVYVALGCTPNPDRKRFPDKGEKIEKVEELSPAEIEKRLFTHLSAASANGKKGRNSYASLHLAMTWAEKHGLFDKPVTDASPTLVIIAGLPLAGKTTLGDALQDRLGIKYVDIDRLREQVTGLLTKEQNDELWKKPDASKIQEQNMRIAYQAMHEGAVNAMLGAGRSIIISATYSRKGSQEFLAGLTRKHGAKVKIVLCTIKNPTPEELERRMAREAGRKFVSGCNSWADYQDISARYQSVTTTGVFLAEQILEIDTGQPLESYLPRVTEFVRS